MTAVEFLIEQFKIYLPSIHQKGLQDAFEQAKGMEKEQIMDAISSCTDGMSSHCQDFEEWFNNL